MPITLNEARHLAALFNDDAQPCLCCVCAKAYVQIFANAFPQFMWESVLDAEEPYFAEISVSLQQEDRESEDAK